MFIIQIFHFQSRVHIKKQTQETMPVDCFSQTIHCFAASFPSPLPLLGAKRQLGLSGCALVNHGRTQFRKSNCCSLTPIKRLCA